jgi:hypothetical protein
MGSSNEMTTTVLDDGLTIKNFAPLYGYGLDGRPNYSKAIGQYSSVDILIPVGESGAYTCQQTSFIGTHYDGAWFQDQVTASGICDSPLDQEMYGRAVEKYLVDWEGTRVHGFDELAVLE